MPEWNIWLEGFQGCSLKPKKAALVATISAPTFEEACAKYIANNANNPDCFEFSFYYNAEENTFCGRRFFDNEKAARKKFG